MKKITISLLAFTLAVLLAAPAMAASITPYASMRFGTFWGHRYDTDTSDSDDDLNMDIARIARFGAKGQVGDIYGVVEVGWEGCENRAGKDMTASGVRPYYNRDVYGRLLYGKWDFGSGNLIVGQDYTPPTYPSAQQAPGVFDIQNGFIGVGCLWDRRWPQLKVVMDNGFYVAAVETYDGIVPDGRFLPPVGAVSGGDSDVAIPKMYVGYDFKQEGLYLGLGAGYNTFDYDDTNVGGEFDDDVTSYLIFLKGAADLGAVDLKFAGHYGENLADFGILGRPGHQVVVTKADGDKDTEDTTCWGGYLQGSFKADPATISLGVGYASDDNDAFEDADETMGYFVQAKIPIADNFFIVPEVSYWDNMDDMNDAAENDYLYVGILWQMNF